MRALEEAARRAHAQLARFREIMTKKRNEPLQVTDSSATMPGVEITDAMLKVIQRYVDRKLTRADAAARLDLSERQVTRVVEELGLSRTKSPRAIAEEQAAARRAAKDAAAEAFLKQQITLAQAALRAGCHPRTIARAVERIEKARKKKR